MREQLIDALLRVRPVCSELLAQRGVFIPKPRVFLAQRGVLLLKPRVLLLKPRVLLLKPRVFLHQLEFEGRVFHRAG
jgi:hypothetical protein